MLPLETLSFRFWFEVMTPRLISSHQSWQELIPFSEITLQKINTVGVSRSPSYSSDISPSGYAIFGTLKKALWDKRFTSDDDVKQYRYVRNWFTTQPREFLRDSHSPPCVAVGQVPPQSGLILLTYKLLVSIPRPPARFLLNAPL